MDITNAEWVAMSDTAIAQTIGAFVKHHRLTQNRTQQQIANAAGINRSTLSQLEKGGTVTIATLLQVLRHTTSQMLQVLQHLLVTNMRHLQH